jgi:hypothetical protein
MIFGNHDLIHVDNSEYIRVGTLGRLHQIAESMGMDVPNSRIMGEAIDELWNQLKESMYKEVKGKIHG